MPNWPNWARAQAALTAERERITNELSENQMQRLANEKDIGLHEAALEGLQSRTGEAEARARELNAAIEAAKAKIESQRLKDRRDRAHPRREQREDRRRRGDHPHGQRRPHGKGSRRGPLRTGKRAP